MLLKWTPLQAAAGAAAISLVALVQIRVSADQSSPQSVPPAERGAVSSPTKPSSSSAPKAITKTNSALDRHATRGQYLARTALSYRGVPYRWGGRSPRTGFDCSGLVQSVYAKWGLYLPRVASAQIKKGVPVKPDKLLPGDLVFFKNTYKRGISHVGIYIGNNYFIHAAGRGKGVCVSRLAGYHKRHWAGARRLNLSKLPPVPGEETPPTRIILQETPDAPAQSIDMPAPQQPNANPAR